MSEQAERLKERARRFALDIVRLIKLLPVSDPGPTVRKQLARSATSIDLNYRAACRARTHAEFTARIGVVAEEAEETASWLDFIGEAGLLTSAALPHLQRESTELVAIFSACVGTARRNERKRRCLNKACILKNLAEMCRG